MENKKCCKSIKNDYVVCTCMEVMYSDITKAIHEGTDTFDKLSERFGVGTGCSSCISEVHEIINEEKGSK